MKRGSTQTTDAPTQIIKSESTYSNTSDHAWKITKRGRKSNINNVEIKILIQEAHTTIGQTISLRVEAHIQRMLQAKLLIEEAHTAIYVI